MEAKSDEEEDDFQTDDDEEMEVDKQEQQKRKKVRENCLKLPFIQMSGICYKNSTGFCNDTTGCHIHVFQVQGGGFQKKFRNNHWKSGRKKRGKVWRKMQIHTYLVLCQRAPLYLQFEVVWLSLVLLLKTSRADINLCSVIFTLTANGTLSISQILRWFHMEIM